MPQVELCLAQAPSAGMEGIEEVAQTIRFMMPTINLTYVVGRDHRMVRFMCEGVDTLTLSSAIVLLKRLLRPLGDIREVSPYE